MPRPLPQARIRMQAIDGNTQPEISNQSSTAVLDPPSRRSIYLAPYSASPFTGLLPRRINNLFREMEAVSSNDDELLKF